MPTRKNQSKKKADKALADKVPQLGPRKPPGTPTGGAEVRADLGVPQVGPKQDRGTTRGGGAEVRVPPKSPSKKKAGGGAIVADKVPQVVDPPPPGTPSGGAQVRGKKAVPTTDAGVPLPPPRERGRAAGVALIKGRGRQSSGASVDGPPLPPLNPPKGGTSGGGAQIRGGKLAPSPKPKK